MTLDEMQARCDAATPGPWCSEIDEYNGHPDPDAVQRQVMAGVNDELRRVAICEPEHSLDGGYDKQPTANAAFIAHARTDMPRLIAVVKVLKGFIDDFIHCNAPVTGKDPAVETARDALARVTAILEGK